MSRSRYIFLAILLILVAIAMFVAVFILVREDSSSGGVVLPTQISTATPVLTPTPTPTPTSPLYKIDTDGGGLDDFNEIYVYGMDPYDAADDAVFLSSIPDVEAEYSTYSACMTNDYLTCLPVIVDFSKRDPYLQWIADRVIVFWLGGEGISGQLMIQENAVTYSFIFNKYVNYNLSTTINPAYYFSHHKDGKCLDSAIANYTVLTLKGWDCEYIEGIVEGDKHAWLEVSYLGDLYVVNFNDIMRADLWYADHADWSINYRQEFD